jgi:hypothetical protein
MGKVAGVTEQRQGQIDNRETVGGVERAVAQSSYITEKWFFYHDETKNRVLNALLDTARQLWSKSKSRKLNFVLDDLSRQFLEFNGEDFASSEYDLFSTSSSRDAEIREAIKSLAHAEAQNGAGFSTLIDVLRSESISEMARRVERSEDEMLQRTEQQQKSQQESQERVAAMIEEGKAKDREIQMYEIDRRTEVEYAKLGVQASQSEVEEPYEDNSLDYRKQALNEQKVIQDANIKNRQLDESIRHNQAAESIARNKPKPKTK